MRKVIWYASLLSIFAIGAVHAANVHLKPPNSDPEFTDQVLQLLAKASISGLGNGDVTIFLEAKANPIATCTNPGSGVHQPPGQNPAEVTVTGSQAIPQDQIKNGNVSFMVRTDPPTTPVVPPAECPNVQWTEDIVDMEFTNAVITINQPPGNPVLVVSCTFTPATANGLVPKQTVACE